MTDKIPLPSDDELDKRTRDFIATLPNLSMVRMLARTGISPEIYTTVSAIFNDDWFPELDREIMLYRTCYINDSQYEIQFHKAVYDLPEALVDAVLSDDLSSLEPWHRTLCELCDEITLNAKLSPQSVAKLVDHYGDYNGATRAIFVMAWFNMLSRFADSTGVPDEAKGQVDGVKSPVS